MSEYAKKKNDELIALCKERNLAHTGKKADLVKRLEDHDAQSTTAVPAPKAAIEDEIDWDEDDSSKPTTAPAAAAVAAGGVGEAKTPAAVPNQKVVEDPAKKNDLSATVPATANGEAKAEEPKKEEKDFTAGDAERTLEAEIEKRKARARRFGMPEDSEEIRKLERALRFGTTDLPGNLNKALPSDRKRGADAGNDGERKRSRGPGGKAQGGDKPQQPKKEDIHKKDSSGYASWMTEDDRKKAEARKAKFAPAPAAA